MFDLNRVREEITPSQPLPEDRDLVAAVLNDFFFPQGCRPLTVGEWKEIQSYVGGFAPLAFLALALKQPSTRAASAEAAAKLREPAFTVLKRFLKEVVHLSKSQLLDGALRREELARQWIFALHGSIDGEKPTESERKRLELDYRVILRKMEQAKREQKGYREKWKEMARKLREQAEERSSYE